MKGENSKLSDLLDRKTDSLEKEREDHYNTKKALEADVQVLKDKVANAQDELERESSKAGSVSLFLFRKSKMSRKSMT